MTNNILILEGDHLSIKKNIYFTQKAPISWNDP